MKKRGATINPVNIYQSSFIHVDEDAHIEDVPASISTKFHKEYPNSVISKVNSPDLPFSYSVNPYQGCEHGCSYCYARNSHQYWGFNSGTDFESNIIVKHNAAEVLEKEFLAPSYQPKMLAFSGNTDCYQPAERKFRITRKLLKVALRYRNPVGIITKNALIQRDVDILSEMAEMRLVKVILSITTFNENLRSKLEPRTSTSMKRLNTIEVLSKAGIPCSVMVAPVIPGLNSHEMAEIIKRSSAVGALTASYTMIRLNGQLGVMFISWLEKHYPNAKEKVLNQIKSIHGGSLNDSVFGRRMRGQGVFAETLRSIFHKAVQKHMPKSTVSEYDFSLFRKGGNISLFDLKR